MLKFSKEGTQGSHNFFLDLLRKFWAEGALGQFKSEPFDCVIPAWSAGIQADMDVSGRILADLDAGNPCQHDEDLHFHVL